MRELKIDDIELGSSIDEKTIVEVSDVSALPWEVSIECLDLPEELKGIKILDVGGGASDLTAEFIKRGADAYSIDPRYESLPNLVRRVKKNIGEGFLIVNKERDIQVLKRFRKSFKTNPRRYKTAFATSLPFPDNYFDTVFSINCITTYLSLDPEVLADATFECIRVTKPGGQIQFFPYQDIVPFGGPHVTSFRLKHQRRLERMFRESTLVAFKIQDNMLNGMNRLIISKK